jgi:signal transduction histidine kinase
MRRSLSLRLHREAVARYTLALFVTVLMLVIRRALDPLLGTYIPYLLVLPAVVISARYCGVGPSILTSALAFFGEQYWFIPPLHTFAIVGATEWASAVVYFVVSAVIILFAENNRHTLASLALSIEKLEQASEALRNSHEHLERRVKERTRELQAKNIELIHQAEVVRELSGRLLQTQDEERRRLARDLHDSLGQLVAALGMNLSLLPSALPQLGRSETRLVTDCMATVQELSRQIRTISHLLHPPLLDEVGLSSALQWYVEEFAQRSNIKVTLELSPELGRLPRDAEISIFRVVQECLTNIHRHSGSTTAGVRITCVNGDVRTEVWDAGKGISPERLSLFSSAGRGGVGIRGMRERLRQFGGTLEVSSGANGTVVIATLPSAHAAAVGGSEQVA